MNEPAMTQRPHTPASPAVAMQADITRTNSLTLCTLSNGEICSLYGVLYPILTETGSMLMEGLAPRECSRSGVTAT